MRNDVHFLKVFAIIATVLLIFISTASGATTYGPQRFTRTDGAPDVYSETFQTVAAPGTIVVLNGKPSGDKRIPYAISSARVFLNDVQIFGPSDFNQTVYNLEAPIDLAEQNTLRVELQSEPGSILTIEIIQDISPPGIISFNATPESILPNESSVLEWDTENTESCTISPDIGSVSLDGSVSVSPSETTIYVLTATGGGTSVQGSATVTVTPFLPEVSLSASPTVINKGESTVLTWSSTNVDQVFIDNGIGNVSLNESISLAPTSTTTYRITATGVYGSASEEIQITVLGSPAPMTENSFGDRYQQIIPPDAVIESYDEERFAIVTGSITDINQLPLSGVQASVYNHPEYGTSITDIDGKFSLPVEGGATIKIAFQKSGYIKAQRKILVPWNDFAVIDLFQMIEEDPVATTVTFNDDPNYVKTHRISIVLDEFGSRSCTMVFQGDNHAYATDANGNDIFELTKINTRATEFTTQDSMPAVLPPNSAYTYCTELSVDGVENVRFEKPVITWVENFLGFDVGETIPVGYYDRNRSVWVPSENGIVGKLLDTDNDGVVDALDVTGDDVPDDLNNDGIFSNEVTGLDNPSLYIPGTTYWRVPVSHFSPHDYNLPNDNPEGAEPSNAEADPFADIKTD